MFNRKVSLLEVKEQLFEHPSSWLVVYRNVQTYNRTICDYKRSLQYRMYCLTCGHSHFQEIETEHYYYMTSDIWKLFKQHNLFHRCPSCGLKSDSLAAIKWESAPSDEGQVLSPIYLEDLTQETVSLIEQIQPHEAQAIQKENLRGYQVVRYQSVLEINQESLEIKTVHLNGERVYIHLENGKELAYQETEDQQVVKISKDDVFLNHNPCTHRDLILNVSEEHPILKESGLLRYLKKTTPYKGQFQLESVDDIYRYEQLRKKYPCIEILVKSGYEELVKKLLGDHSLGVVYEAEYAKILLNPNGTYPSEILGYSTSVLKKLKEMHGFNDLRVAYHLKLMDIHSPITLSTLNLMENKLHLRNLTDYTKEIIFLLKQGYTYQELIECVLLNENKTGRNLEYLKGYISMSMEMGVPYVKFPQNIKESYKELKSLSQSKTDELILKKAF